MPLITAINGPRRPEKKVVDSGRYGCHAIQCRGRWCLSSTCCSEGRSLEGNTTQHHHCSSRGITKGVESVREGLSKAVAGDLGQFALDVHDRFDNHLWQEDVIKGGLVGGKRMERGEKLACNVVDHNNGSYSLSYTAVVTGEYKLSLAINGDVVEGFPLPVIVRPTDTNPATTYAWGTGLRKCQWCEKLFCNSYGRLIRKQCYNWRGTT